MLKQITTGLTLIISVAAFSQVGIETETPQATLDVVGKPADASVLDGIIAPRIEGAQLRAKAYTTTQTGALVYVTLADTAPAGQTIDVTAPGYYYFNGTKWVIAGAGDMVNIYNADGSLTGSGTRRILTINGKELSFEGTNERTFWSADGSLNQLGSAGRASFMLYGGNDSNLQIQSFENAEASISATDNSTSLHLATHATNQSAPITFSTSAGSNALATEKMRITGEGNIGIQTNTPTERLDNEGITRLRGLPLNGATNAIFTTSGGTASTTQNQTFTATRTLVADANGVVGYVTGLPAATQNIYNVDGSLTGSEVRRTLNLNGKELTFTGTGQRTTWAANGGLFQQGLSSSATKHASISLSAADNNANSISSNLTLQIYPEQSAQILAVNDATALALSTHNTVNAAPITFTTSAGANAAGTEKMRITGTGNVGIGTNNPTERFHNNGNVRLQGLPLNGATNAIFTTSGGGASATQNQTFTAIRTVVADANGVLGYVEGLPSTAPIDDGTLNVGQEIYWYGEAPANIGGGTVTPTNYLSSHAPDVPVMDGMRFDFYFLSSVSGAGTISGQPRLVNASGANLKVNFSAMSSVQNYGSNNIILGPGHYINLDDGIYNGYGLNMTTASTPASYTSPSTSHTEIETVDLWVNNRWYRASYYPVIDNNNTTSASDDIRKISISVKRLR